MTQDKDLTLTPLKGKSGQAFLGTYPSGERVFVKMDTVPILAALADEQITPHLLWTKRKSSGEMMSAQEWLNGRLLERVDMTSKQIVQILIRLHRSKTLVKQLMRLGYKVEEPYRLLQKWQRRAPFHLRNNHYLQSVIDELMHNLPDFNEELATIVHGDVRHTNWIITTSGLIYLVDWDTVRLTDRMYDVAQIMSHYIPKDGWRDWLVYYGYKDNTKVWNKFFWYGQLSYLNQIMTFFEMEELDKVNQEIYDLRQFRKKINQISKGASVYESEA